MFHEHIYWFAFNTGKKKKFWRQKKHKLYANNLINVIKHKKLQTKTEI